MAHSALPKGVGIRTNNQCLPLLVEVAQFSETEKGVRSTVSSERTDWHTFTFKMNFNQFDFHNVGVHIKCIQYSFTCQGLRALALPTEAARFSCSSNASALLLTCVSGPGISVPHPAQPVAHEEPQLLLKIQPLSLRASGRLPSPPSICAALGALDLGNE